jgi:hypothetical protein
VGVSYARVGAHVEFASFQASQVLKELFSIMERENWGSG